MTVTRARAAEICGLTDSQLKNAIGAGEFGPLAPRERLSQSSVDTWIEQRPIWQLERDSYLRALEFAAVQYYRGGSRSDFGSGVRRTAGKFVDDHASGKLGELGLAMFLEQRHGVVVDIDFGHYDEIPAQDIEYVRDVRSRSRNPAGIRVSIKTTKFGNSWLLIPDDEFSRSDRRSDAYVLVRCMLPGDHLLRELYRSGGLVGIREHLDPETVEMLSRSDFRVQIAGFAWRDDITDPPVTSIGGDFELAKPNRAVPAGRLRTSPDDWNQLVARMLRRE